METVSQLRRRLEEAFGFKRFRPDQSRACEAAMEGRDTLLLMPTGSGKSLCYQLPGLELDGVTVVVSPLISLAEDQAAGLRERGIAAVIFNSTKTARQTRRFRQDVAAGKCEFVFTTPERLQQTDLCEMLAGVGVDLFVIDEAHCVSQWGHDFRPDYLSLHHARARLGNPPILAMTATASPPAVDEIRFSLRLIDPVIVSNGMHRSNLHLAVVPCDGPADKQRHLRRLLTEQDVLTHNEPAIVYCNTIKEVQALQASLQDLHVQGATLSVLAYHGRMNKADRKTAQDAFMDGPPAVMVATNAFGMGIDKPDIRRVIHYSLPGSMEAYYQEIGRAGRDGKRSACTLLYDPADAPVLKMFAGGHIDSSQLITAHHCLRQAVRRFGDDDGGVSLKDVQPISSLGRQTLQNCLQLLASSGVVAPAGRGRWICLVDDIDHDLTDRLADNARMRSEDRQIAVRQMIDYCQSSTCRWSRLLHHFDDVDADKELDCDCDACQRSRPPAVFATAH